MISHGAKLYTVVTNGALREIYDINSSVEKDEVNLAGSGGNFSQQSVIIIIKCATW